MKLKQTKVKISLSEEERIKNKSISSKTLYFIRPTGDIVLKIDASELAFGGTLSQMQPDETGTTIVERDIAFFSKQ